MPENAVRTLSRKLGCSPVLATLLLRVDPGHAEVEKARRFLEPKLAHLEDPWAIPGMRAAVERMGGALQGGKRFLIFGDYDVDGITSTAALVHFLRTMGADPDFVVPLRLDEGYGMTPEAVARALEGKPRPDLFIALDCGTNAREEVGRLLGQGIEVVVVDHHQAKGDLPEGAILVNPHVRPGEGAGQVAAAWLDLCTAGLVFKLIHGMVKWLREAGDGRAQGLRVADYLDLAALGTVADLVPLREENRLIARFGLLRLERSERPGIHALMESAGVDPAAGLDAAAIGFRLGPRLNASGRLADARQPIEMLLGESFAECRQVADLLGRMNRERQEIEKRIAQQALEQVEARGWQREAGLVLFQEDWHTGVVGIVASRMVQEFHRPCLVLGMAEGLEYQGRPFAKGSGRSVEGVDLTAVLRHCGPLLQQWGGHPRAVGVTVAPENIPALQEAFAAGVRRECGSEHPPEPELSLSAWVSPEEVTGRLMEELGRMEPFGMGNPRPVFGLRAVRLAGPVQVLKERHFRFGLATKRGNLGGIAWGLADRPPPPDRAVHLAVRLSWNHWNGDKHLQLEMVDWKLA